LQVSVCEDFLLDLEATQQLELGYIKSEIFILYSVFQGRAWVEMGSLSKGEDLFFTRTMAVILERQGHMEDALFIYKMLSDADPEDKTLTEKVEKLKALAGKRRVQKERIRGG
jgi:hypothetical protein